jgi:hypothetical protein
MYTLKKRKIKRENNLKKIPSYTLKCSGILSYNSEYFKKYSELYGIKAKSEDLLNRSGGYNNVF